MRLQHRLFKDTLSIVVSSFMKVLLAHYIFTKVLNCKIHLEANRTILAPSTCMSPKILKQTIPSLKKIKKQTYKPAQILLHTFHFNCFFSTSGGLPQKAIAYIIAYVGGEKNNNNKKTQRRPRTSEGSRVNHKVCQ